MSDFKELIYCTLYITFSACYTGHQQGRLQDLIGGGNGFFFFRFGNLHVAKRHAAHGEAMRIAREFGGMLPRENFLKRCNLVHFRVYFDQILSLFLL